ncbi:MAG: tRNA pseudouridine(55) synthase [Luteitalea sp.]|nr:tRNA pseudouridine(55) synthase [Luteitalea sp.]
MDGLLVVDKPSGPTSHDVVARVRRVLRERRIGHTGTLDPMATGVLPLVIGRATRLARFMSASDKIYQATIRFGFATDSADATGRRLGAPFGGPLPTRDVIERALDAFRGTYAQQPPAFSAKKIGGTRSYELARQAARAARALAARPHASEVPGPPGLLSAPPDLPGPPAALPDPVRVTAHAIDVVSCTGDTATLRVHCTAGFYVRSLAHDLGERLGVGAHLTALCRSSAGEFGLEHAITLTALEDDAHGVARAHEALVPLARMLPAFPACLLTLEGMRRAVRGRDLGPADFAEPSGRGPGDRLAGTAHFRLVAPDGALVAVAEVSPTPGLLHPLVVLM